MLKALPSTGQDPCRQLQLLLLRGQPHGSGERPGAGSHSAGVAPPSLRAAALLLSSLLQQLRTGDVAFRHRLPLHDAGRAERPPRASCRPGHRGARRDARGGIHAAAGGRGRGDALGGKEQNGLQHASQRLPWIPCNAQRGRVLRPEL